MITELSLLATIKRGLYVNAASVTRWSLKSVTLCCYDAQCLNLVRKSKLSFAPAINHENRTTEKEVNNIGCHIGLSCT